MKPRTIKIGQAANGNGRTIEGETKKIAVG
jgi:hypothetical protein